MDKRVRPPYKTNPAHDPFDSRFNPKKSPEPADAEQLYKDARRSDMGTWWAKNSEGNYYRFSYDNVGEVHFSGEFLPTNPNIPVDVRRYYGD